MASVEIYTDGSHFGSHVGFGAWCHYGDREFRLAQKCTFEVARDFGLTQSEVKIISNPTAEFMALAYVLKSLADLKTTYDLTLIVHSDYVGVQKWMSGEWSAKKSYIRSILGYCKRWLVAHPNVNLELKHVKGHAGVKGNEMADELAKSRSACNTFDQMRDMLNSHH